MSARPPIHVLQNSIMLRDGSIIKMVHDFIVRNVHQYNKINEDHRDGVSLFFTEGFISLETKGLANF